MRQTFTGTFLTQSCLTIVQVVHGTHFLTVTGTMRQTVYGTFLTHSSITLRQTVYGTFLTQFSFTMRQVVTFSHVHTWAPSLNSRPGPSVSNAAPEAST